MESAGAVDMFCHSLAIGKLIYNGYLGDGDSSDFKDVVDGKPYVVYNIDPEKYECMGHVQKRLGTRLRNKVKEFKCTKTPLSGRNKLAKRTIDSMQNWFGMTIRRNSEDVYKMKRAIGAVLWHCTAFENYDDDYPPDAIFNNWPLLVIYCWYKP